MPLHLQNWPPSGLFEEHLPHHDVEYKMYLAYGFAQELGRGDSVTKIYYCESDAVRNVMIENIDKVLERGDRSELLVDKTENLQGNTLRFRKQTCHFRSTVVEKHQAHKLPPSFVRKCEDHVPEHVTLNICNGYQYYVRFHKDRKKLKILALFYNDFRTDSDFYALFYYKGAGIFTIFILDDSGMEIDFPAAKKLPLAPVYLEDNIDGIGKKFIVDTVEKHRGSAEIDIPPAFVDRFRYMLKQKNFLTLKNGDKLMKFETFGPIILPVNIYRLG